MTTERTELKPCPFCGAEPEDCPQNSERPHPHRKGDWTVYIWCDNCNARGPEKREPDEAITAWNTRSLTPQAGEGVVERVRNLAPPYVGPYDLDEPGFGKGWRAACKSAAVIIAALPPAGRVEELEKALEPFAAAAQLFTSGVHNGGFENVQAFPTAQEWRIAGSLFPEYQGMTSFPKAEALRAALGSHNG